MSQFFNASAQLHDNPCSNKILFPLLKRGSTKQPRVQSQPSRHHSPDKSRPRTQSENKTRHNSEKNSTDGSIKQGFLSKQKKQVDFLEKCFQHIMLQNNCLVEQLLMKDKQLDRLKEEIGKKKKADQKNQHKKFKEMLHKIQNQRNQITPFLPDKSEQMEVILSVDSEDQCSLEEDLKKQNPSFEMLSSSSRTQLVNLKKKLDNLDFSKLDKLRMRKGLISRRKQEPENVDLKL